MSGKRLYFIGPVADFLLIGGGSILLFGWLAWPERREATPLMFTWAYWLSWVINWPHFSSTSYRLYRSPQTRAQYPVTAYVIPVLMIGAVVGSFAAPEQVAPYFVKMFAIWSPYHFAAQSLGISLIYARRSGFFVTQPARYALSGFLFGTFFFTTAAAEVGLDKRTYFGLSYPTLGLPVEVAVWAERGMYACGALFLLYAVYWCVKERRLVPPIVLLPALTQYVWFVPGARVESFQTFVPMFHSLQYLLIAWAMQVKEKMDENQIEPSRSYVGWESLRWGVINIAGGAALFFLIPRAMELTGYPQHFAEPVVISAVQIHHFFVDGVIWKLKNPRVGSPLLVNIDDLVRREAAPQTA